MTVFVSCLTEENAVQTKVCNHYWSNLSNLQSTVIEKMGPPVSEYIVLVLRAPDILRLYSQKSTTSGIRVSLANAIFH